MEHMIMRLEYPTSDPTRWAQDKLYIEDILEATPSELLDPLFDLLNLDMCWTQGRGDGDIDDKCEAICSWYDNHFRPYLRQMVRKDMPKIGLRVSWKALECYIYEFYIESERWPCGQLRGFEARVKELKS